MVLVIAKHLAVSSITTLFMCKRYHHRFFPYFKPSLPESDVRIGATSASAALVARDTIKSRGILPPTFDLNIKFADSKCSSVATLESLLESWDGDEA